MSAVAQRLRNSARFQAPVAPNERERAADTIEALTAALTFVRANTNLCPIADAAVTAALAKAEVETSTPSTVAAQESRADERRRWIYLSAYISGAHINASDHPHTVLCKLQDELDASAPPVALRSGLVPMELLSRLQASAEPTATHDGAVVPAPLWREFVDAHAAALHGSAPSTGEVRTALLTAQRALRGWTNLYAKLQNESGYVVSRKLDYNLPPAEHVKALEAIEEALQSTPNAEKPLDGPYIPPVIYDAKRGGFYDTTDGHRLTDAELAERRKDRPPTLDCLAMAADLLRNMVEYPRNSRLTVGEQHLLKDAIAALSARSTEAEP